MKTIMDSPAEGNHKHNWLIAIHPAKPPIRFTYVRRSKGKAEKVIQELRLRVNDVGNLFEGQNVRDGIIYRESINKREGERGQWEVSKYFENSACILWEWSSHSTAVKTVLGELNAIQYLSFSQSFPFCLFLFGFPIFFFSVFASKILGFLSNQSQFITIIQTLCKS